MPVRYIIQTCGSSVYYAYIYKGMKETFCVDVRNAMKLYAAGLFCSIFVLRVVERESERVYINTRVCRTLSFVGVVHVRRNVYYM